MIAILTLEPIGMKVLGIFLGMLFGWTFIGFIWPSILGAIALGFSGYATVSSVISSGMGNISVTLGVFFDKSCRKNQFYQ